MSAPQSLPRLVAEALRAAVPLDLRGIRELLRTSGGGVQIVYTSAALEVRVEVLVSPGPGTLRAERGDALYLVLDGQGVMGMEDGNPSALVTGGATVVPAGVKHVVFGNPRLEMLVVSAPGWRPAAPLAACRKA